MHDEQGPSGHQPEQRPHHPRVVSLKTRLRWSYTLVSVIPLVVLSIILFYNRLGMQRESLLDTHSTSAKWITREIGRYLELINRIFIDDLGPNVGANRSEEDVHAVVAQLIKSSRDIVDVSIMNDQGQERVRISKLQVFHSSELVDRSAELLVREALSGVIAYGPIERQSGGTLTYVTFVPIKSGTGRVLGAIRAVVSARPIADALRGSLLEEGSYAYLVDDRAALLLPGANAQQPASASQLGPLLHGAAEIGEYTNGDGTVVLGTRERLEGPDWWVVVETPRETAYASVNRENLFMIFAIGIVIITTIGWGLYQARRILRPVEAVRAGAVSMGNGDLSARIPMYAEDEIGDLAREFNRMAGRLQQSLAQIEQQNDRLRRGLVLAREIQLGLLPDRAPWDAQQILIRGRSIPAMEVGGDLYLFVGFREQHLAAVAIGDISGKGIGAALMMALVSSAAEAQARVTAGPADLLNFLNRDLTPRLRNNHMNAALLYLLIDMQRQRITMSNAGMISPLLLRAGQVEYLEAYGVPLGSIPDMLYQELQLDLMPGDVLLLISDGIVEARNQQGELFGFERLEQVLHDELDPANPQALVETLIAQVLHFMGEIEQHDDMTVVVIQPQQMLAPSFVQQVPQITATTTSL